MRRETASLPERGVVVLNPASAGGRARARFACLRPALRAWPLDLEIVETRGVGDASRLAAAAAEAGAGLVVVAGGDGTVNEVINGLRLAGVTSEVSVSFLPVGTGCDFARNLGLSRQPAGLAPPPEAERLVDLGSLRLGGSGNGATRYFVNAVNVGASVAATRRVNRSRLLRRLGAAAYVTAGVPELLARPVTRVRLQIEGEAPVRTEVLNLSVCNGARFGGGLALAPAAHLDDGHLHLALITERRPDRVAHTLWRGYAADANPRPNVQLCTTRRLELVGDAAIEIDGELPGTLPARLECCPAALRVLVPTQD